MATTEWSIEDTDFMLKNYPSKGRNFCAAALNRSIGSVAGKARRMGLLSSVTRSNKVADEYINWLQTNKPDIILLTKYTLSSVPTLHKHTVCGHEWKIRPNNLKRSTGSGCPNCAPNKKYSNESYISKLDGTKFTVLEEYLGSDIKILHRHESCGYEWEVRPHDIIQGQGCPKCNKKNYSKVAIEWMKSFNNPNIIHAENGGEEFIMGHKVDGFDPIENTIYEFHGDCYHGNLDMYHEDDKCHPFNKDITAGELWENTYNKMYKLATKHNVVFIWERDYRNGKASEYIKASAR